MKKIFPIHSGFTLIELLVVIAIIGILSSVVLASLNSARDRGRDAAIKANLANARAEAELYYDTNNNYNIVCGYDVNGIGKYVTAAEQVYTGDSLNSTAYGNSTASKYNTAQCHATAGAWAAWVPLRASTASSISAHCVDSTGVSKRVTAVLGSNVFACP